MSKKVLGHFKRNDSVLYAVALKIKRTDIFKPYKSQDYFLSLCREITSQQLADGAANAIFGRFLKLFPRQKVTARRLLNIPDEKLRGVGMAWAKVRSLKDLAQKVASREVRLDNLENLPEEAVRTELMKVKGIGPWTAEMFLMFALGREDVFSHGDLGLRKAIRKIYKVDGELTKEYAEKLSLRWSPYRTYACRVLWQSIDSK